MLGLISEFNPPSPIMYHHKYKIWTLVVSQKSKSSKMIRKVYFSKKVRVLKTLKPQFIRSIKVSISKKFAYFSILKLAYCILL